MAGVLDTWTLFWWHSKTTGEIDKPAVRKVWVPHVILICFLPHLLLLAAAASPSPARCSNLQACETYVLTCLAEASRAVVEFIEARGHLRAAQQTPVAIRAPARRPPERMGWIWMVFAAGSVLLWAISLGRIELDGMWSSVPHRVSSAYWGRTIMHLFCAEFRWKIPV